MTGIEALAEAAWHAACAKYRDIVRYYLAEHALQGIWTEAYTIGYAACQAREEQQPTVAVIKHFPPHGWYVVRQRNAYSDYLCRDGEWRPMCWSDGAPNTVGYYATDQEAQAALDRFKQPAPPQPDPAHTDIDLLSACNKLLGVCDELRGNMYSPNRSGVHELYKRAMAADVELRAAMEQETLIRLSPDPAPVPALGLEPLGTDLVPDAPPDFVAAWKSYVDGPTLLLRTAEALHFWQAATQAAAAQHAAEIVVRLKLWQRQG